jgi:tetratricopeptide (TPR) repeat protein
MLGLGWLILRQAQEALKQGRLEEAHRLLNQPTLQGHKRLWELLQQVARAFAERGERQLRRDDAVAAWNDLLLAEQATPGDSAAARLRSALSRLGLAEVRALLEAGEPVRAVEAIAQLRDKAVRLPELEPLEEGARDWAEVRELANRGEFAQALQRLQRVRKLLHGSFAALEKLQNDLENRNHSFTALLVQLHEAAQQARWHEVLQLSEQVLAVAPQHAEARKVRSKAWKAIEPLTVVTPRARDRAEAVSAETSAPVPSERFLLWIDGVGGFLVCLGNRVTLGQATPDTVVDVPIFADVSRLHARITRDTEGYLLEALRAVQVNGKEATRALLRPGDRITLGTCCQVQFRQPVPVSASARLDLVSGHRLRLAVDGVLLMADTLVLGPGSQVHVAMPDLAQPVILFRQKEGLGVRHAGNLAINGRPCRERGTLEPGATVSGENFSLSLETIGTQMGRT